MEPVPAVLQSLPASVVVLRGVCVHHHFGTNMAAGNDLVSEGETPK